MIKSIALVWFAGCSGSSEYDNVQFADPGEIPSYRDPTGN